MHHWELSEGRDWVGFIPFFSPETFIVRSGWWDAKQHMFLLVITMLLTVESYMVSSPLTGICRLDSCWNFTKFVDIPLPQRLITIVIWTSQFNPDRAVCLHPPKAWHVGWRHRLSTSEQRDMISSWGSSSWVYLVRTNTVSMMHIKLHAIRHQHIFHHLLPFVLTLGNYTAMCFAH